MKKIENNYEMKSIRGGSSELLAEEMIETRGGMIATGIIVALIGAFATIAAAFIGRS